MTFICIRDTDVIFVVGTYGMSISRYTATNFEFTEKFSYIYSRFMHVYT